MGLSGRWSASIRIRWNHARISPHIRRHLRRLDLLLLLLLLELLLLSLKLLLLLLILQA